MNQLRQLDKDILIHKIFDLQEKKAELEAETKVDLEELITILNNIQMFVYVTNYNEDIMKQIDMAIEIANKG